MGEVIEEIKRDSSLDYLIVLRLLLELPFAVGKNLLADILIGNYKNKSISANQLDELHHFGKLSWKREKVLEEIDSLLAHGFIELVPSDYNPFIKVFRLTSRGREELRSPRLSSRQLKNRVSFQESVITSDDRQDFEQWNDFLQGFNESQKKAIVSQASHLLCIAGAGSGKTTVLTKRIEHLIKHKGVSQEKILAITFTRKAKQEMERRLKQLGIVHVHVHTFNSFCERILNMFEYEIYGRRMRVQSYADKMLALHMALSHLGLDISVAVDRYYSAQQKKFKTTHQLANSFLHDCFAVMDFFKLTGIPEYDFSSDVTGAEKEQAKLMYALYQYLKEHMHLQGLRDYSDQLLDTISFFKKNPDKIPSFEHILIDEYQDVNAQQIQLLNLLAPHNLFAVGDPRQSVFGWRGSDVSYILGFEKTYPRTQLVHLTKNYRSSKPIVSFMNAAIRDMGLPDLEHHHEENTASVHLHEFDSEHVEREFVLKQILESSLPRHEMFVLARTNKQLLELSMLMKAANIAHVVKTDELKNPVQESSGEVVLATIHAIKGLEATHVFLMGATEQYFPCKASDHPAIEFLKTEKYNKTEEEKRLFYVALSRAKKKLSITYTGKKPTYFITPDMLKMVS